MKSAQWRRVKVKANALFIVVTVSFVVALILFGFLTIGGVFAKAETEFAIRNKLVRNVKSGLQFCLAADELPEKFVVDLFQEGTDSVLFESFPFGLLTQVKVSAFHAQDTVYKYFVLGNHSLAQSKTALYLANSNKALGVCGHVKLNGDVFVPERGVERVYIEGQNFVGAQLYSGRKSISKSLLPPLHPNIRSNIERAFEMQEGKLFDTEKDSVISGDHPLVFSFPTGISVGAVVKGNVTIISSEFIHVQADAQLENTILRAPVIKVEKGFKGSIQAFATDSLIVEENCDLRFPSALVLKARKNTDFSTKLVVGSSCKVAGNIVLLQERFRLKNNGIITINNNVLVNGSIYSEAYTQLKSCEIQGEVYTKKLFLKTRSSIYENTLLNVGIDPAKKERDMVDLGINNSERSWVFVQ